ncbi:metal ABC transporter permease [Spiribacter pallidus]|jgi:manganese/zinc/iron transport system permease protein|uniref:metal ABC transporter permease n=1 Tax=Spiribacter pallidus TaxID=1987936 RepID=UPI0034A016FE
MSGLANPTIAILLTGMLVGMAGALLGSFLVLRGNSMLADAISHSILFGIALAWLATGETSGAVQIAGAALSGVLAVFLIETLARSRRLRDDAAIGLVFPALFSIGVVLINVFARDVHLDEHTVLLGEIGFVWLDTVTVAGLVVPRALLASATLLLVDALFVLAFYNALKLATFDPGLARALGLAPGLVFYAHLSLLSGTAVAAFDAVGVVLFVTFVVVPPAAAYLLCRRLSSLIAVAMLIAVASAPLGYGAALWLDVSVGGAMALATAPFLVGAFSWRRWRERRRYRAGQPPAVSASSSA